MNKIKLSKYWKVNKETILRNIFFKYCNYNKDIEISIIELKERIREELIIDLECDLNLSIFWYTLEQYIKNNVFNYAYLKKIFKNDIKLTTPKETYKQYLYNNLNNNYYINCLLNV